MSGMWLGKGDANHGRERGRARARGSKRKLGVMSWGKGLINIGLEGRRNEEEEVKRREVAVFNFQSLFPRLRRGEPEPTATLSGDCELEEGTAVPQREGGQQQGGGEEQLGGSWLLLLQLLLQLHCEAGLD